MNKFKDRWNNNPLVSVITYTIIIATACIAVTYFFTFDFKVQEYNNKISDLEGVIVSLNNFNDIKEERIRELERKNAELINLNNKYLGWLNSMPQSIPFLLNEIKILEEKLISDSLKKDEIKSISNSTIQDEKVKYYKESGILKVGVAFYDTKKDVVIGVNDISPDRTISGELKLPNQKQITFNSEKPGKVWDFIYDNKEYLLIIKEVNYTTDTYKVIISEK